MYSPFRSLDLLVSSMRSSVSYGRRQFTQMFSAIASSDCSRYWNHQLNGKVWGCVLGASGVVSSLVAGIGLSEDASAQGFGIVAPIYIQVSVNRVWGNPTVDLPPQRQRPDLYAELAMLGQQVRTPVEPTPRINEDIYPEWRLSAAAERAWLEPGHPIDISVRIFDEDDDDDDKVLFSNLVLDPYTCEVFIGEEQVVPGAWINARSTCVVSIPDLRSETGSAALTISTQWIGASPGR
ncbi:MAG: hypothetical protein AAF327_12870 [Cyanobacteria bacterium P01_A01_bin.37]